jgi:hypothetical protein
MFITFIEKYFEKGTVDFTSAHKIIFHNFFFFKLI